MENLKKRNYELSLWRTKYDGIKGRYTEEKVVTIGSNTSDSPLRAHEPKLGRDVNGNKTLTFSMFYKYWDEDENCLKDNPFTVQDMNGIGLANESRVKLKLDNKWFDFIVKSISEDSSSYKFTYTCKDQNVYELSKTGFNIELSQDLMNNAGTVWQLGEKVLEGTDWAVGSSQSILFNKVREPLYEIDSSIIASQSTITADPDAPAYNTASAFYLSYTLQQQGDLSNQRLYAVFSDDIELDSDNIILNCHQYDCTINAQPASSSVSPYFGKRFVKNTPQIFDPVTQKMVTQYAKQGESSSSIYYGYVENKFYQPNLVDNFITNGKDFTSTKGWKQSVTQAVDSSGAFYLQFPSSSSAWIYNTGIYDYRSKLNGIAKGEEFGLRIKYYGTGRLSNIAVAKTTKGSDITSQIVMAQHGSWYNDNEYLYKFAADSQLSENELETNIYYLWMQGQNVVIQEIELFKWNYGTIYPHQASGTELSSFNGVICPSGYIQLNSLDSTQLSYHPYSEVSFTEDSQSLNSYYVPYASEDKKYYYYLQPQLGDDPIDDPLKISYEICNEKSNDYEEIRGEIGEYEKIKMVEAKESNRMAILQSLCEKFECWMDIEVQHEEDGTISVDEHGAPIKKIKFREYLDTPNAAGFKYGVNLKSVKRNIDSEQISTKIIVKPNSNEFADGGFCTISNASDCPTGENFFYNFDYYINKQGIERDKLIEDLYIYLYPQIKYYNEQIKQLNNEIIQFTPSLENVESKLTIANQGIANAPEEITEKIRLMQIHDKDIEKYHVNANDKGIFNSDGTPWNGFQGKVTSVWRLIEGYYKSVLLLNSQYQEFQRESLAYKEQKKTIEQKINDLKEQIKGYQNLKENLINEFNKKYQPFIAEGNWTSEDYTDPNLYYYDQESVLYESSKPKISYTFDIINVSPLEGYEPYKFQPGDLTYVEDTEFFGWKTDNNGNRTNPYREEVVVYQLDEDLDNPMNDKVSVKTYKSQFEDLFQRIGNTTQNLTFNTGSYQRAAKLVDVNTGISTRALQQAFLDNADILNSIGNQNVTVDNQGITVLNQEDPNERVRIVNGGIFLSEDGGESWKTGITGKGINASEITTGTLNAGLINVSSSYSGRYYGNDGFKDVLAGVTKITEDGVKIFTNVPPSDSQITQGAGGIEYKENPTSSDYGYRTYGQVESSGWQIGIRIPFSVNAQFYENLKEGKNNETLKQITEAKIKVTANWLSGPSAKTIEFDPYTQLYFKDEEQPWKDSWKEDDKIEVDFYDDQQGRHYLCFYFSQVGLRIKDDSSYKNLELEFSYKTALNPNSLLKESTALTLDGVVTKEVNTNIVKQSNISQTSGSFDTLKTSKIKQTEQESNSLELANGGYNCKLYVSNDGYFRIGVYSGQDLNYTLQARGDSSQIWQVIAAES